MKGNIGNCNPSARGATAATSASSRRRTAWGPEGKEIATVSAYTYSEARRKAPQPYRKYLGEIGVEVIL